MADVHFKSGPGTHVSIAGHAGVESADSGGPGGYEVCFHSTATQVTYVNVAHEHSTRGQPARLTSIGRRVAANRTAPGTHRVRPTFGLGSVSSGLHLIGFDVSDVGTSYALGVRGERMPAITVGTNVGHDPSGAPGRQVQEHPTRVRDEHGYRTVTVMGAVHGDPVQVAGSVPLVRLYRIADGLVLPG